MKRFSLIIFLVHFVASIAMAQSPDDPTATYSRSGADTCIGCHDDAATMSVFKTPHGGADGSAKPVRQRAIAVRSLSRTRRRHTQAACAADRSVRRSSVSAPTRKSDVSVQNGMCLDCHSDNVGFAWHGSGHDNDEVACADCHQVHVSHDPVLRTASQPEVCFDCHQQQHSQAMKPYSHPFDEGKMDCSGCHNPHGQTTRPLVRRARP